MNDKLIKMFLIIEKLETKELEKLKTWIDFNLQKREEVKSHG